MPAQQQQHCRIAGSPKISCCRKHNNLCVCCHVERAPQLALSHLHMWLTMLQVLLLLLLHHISMHFRLCCRYITCCYLTVRLPPLLPCAYSPEGQGACHTVFEALSGGQLLRGGDRLDTWH
jgi:hypothetical protein